MEGGEMSSSASKVYLDLLSGTPVPVPVQRRILQWGTSHQDAAVLARLVMIEGLDPDIETELAQSSHLEVLLAWANRPGRTSDDLAQRLLKEKRASLLVGLAGREDLTEEIYEHLSENKSVNVRWALLANTNVKLELREKVAKTLAPEFRKDNFGGRRQLLDSLGTELSLWRIFLENITTNVVVSTAMALDIVDKPIMDRIVSYIEKKASNRVTNHTVTELAQSLSRRAELDSDHVARLLAALEVYYQLIKDNSYSYESRRVQETINQLKARPEGGLGQLLEAVRTASDEVTLISAVQEYENATKNMRLDNSILATAVVNHPLVTIDLMGQYFRNTDYKTWGDFSKKLSSEGRFELLAAIAAQTSLEHLIGLIGFRSEVVRHMLDRAYVGRELDMSRALSSWFQTAVSPESIAAMQDEFIALVPATQLLSSAVLSPFAMVLLEEQLGDNQKNWETFETLVADYQGTLPELLNTVNSLTS